MKWTFEVTTFLLCASTLVHSQRFDTCNSLQAAHARFKADHSYFDKPEKRVTEPMVVATFGPPDDRERTAAGLRLVYRAESCAAAFIFDNDGYFYSGAFREDDVGEVDRNITMYERYKDLNSKIADAERRLTQLKTELPQFESFFRAPIKLSPQEALLFVNAPVEGDALLLANKLPEAIDAYSLRIIADPQNDLAFGRRGIAHHAAGRYAEAVKDFETAFRIKPRETWRIRKLLSGAALGVFYDQPLETPATPSPTSTITVTSEPTSISSAGSGLSYQPRSPPGTAVNVKGYTKKNGTYVAPHTRSSRGTKK